MVNLKNLSKAELQATGFKNVSTARNFIKDILKTKSQKFNKEVLINKLTSEFNKFKDGIKQLAKSVPREDKPAVKYGLKTVLEDIRGEHGKISIIAQINWDFPEYSPSTSKCKIKKVSFNYDDPNTFRKILALKYEEACEIFN